MAAKVGVLSPHQDISESPKTFIKKAVAALLVRRLVAEQLRRGLIRMLVVVPAEEIPASRFRPPNPPGMPDSDPSELLRGGVLRWEPPKHKRDLKPHPWRDLVCS